MAVKYDWSGEAMRHTMGMLDRFTKAEIIEDFEKDTMLIDSRLLDTKQNLYVTSVSRDRYAAVWQYEPDQQTISVKFVVPTQIRKDSSGAELKKRLGIILDAYTNSRFSMEKLGLADQAKAPVPEPVKAKPKPFTL